MRYFIGFLITIGLLVLLIIMLVRGGGKQRVPTTSKSLSSYSTTNAETSMLIDGPVNAAGDHNQILITVNRDNVIYEELKGYDGEVTEMKSFPNTETSYNVFLHALARSGFTRGNEDKALRDERGYCPLGNRYVFRLTQGNDELERFWATNCGGPKSYLGNLDLTIRLFQNQVPEYESLSGGTNL